MRTLLLLTHDDAAALFGSSLHCLMSTGERSTAFCVLGWAYKDSCTYIELPEPDLMTSALLPVQLQF